MIVEHTFVTALPADEAFAAADKIIGPLAFRCESSSGSLRAWRRGQAEETRARQLDDLPQTLRMEFDRGRVAVAAAVDLGRRTHTLPPQLMVALTLALERALVLGHPIATASEDVTRIHTSIQRRDRRVRITGITVLTLIVLAFIGGITLALRQ
jgi:hypothetical protein